MSQSIIRCLAAGWMGTTVWLSLIQAVAATAADPKPQIRVYVYNRAEVETKTLQEAKEVVTRIFRKAGVEAILLDSSPPSSPEQGQTAWRPGPTNFFVQILSLPMAKSFGLPARILGMAPGDPQERNRDQVYVSEPVAEEMAREQAKARESRTVSLHASKGHILGHGIAHEIGHVLLQQTDHSRTGLMRARWDRNDMQNMVVGELGFSREEAARIQQEVGRRYGLR